MPIILLALYAVVARLTDLPAPAFLYNGWYWLALLALAGLVHVITDRIGHS